MNTDHPAGVVGRAKTLDTIAAVPPLDRRDELAELLTDQDVATLRHLVNQGMGPNTIRLAVRATPRPRKRKSAKAVTGDHSASSPVFGNSCRTFDPFDCTTMPIFRRPELRSPTLWIAEARPSRWR